MNTAKRIHLVRDIHLSHMIAFEEDYPARIQTIKRDMEENPKKPHYLLVEGGVIGRIIVIVRGFVERPAVFPCVHRDDSTKA